MCTAIAVGLPSGSVDLYVHVALDGSDLCHRRAVAATARLARHPAVGHARVRAYPLACASGGGGSVPSNSSTSSNFSQRRDAEPLVGQHQSMQQGFAMVADPGQVRLSPV